MKVSIAMATYNGAQYIKEQLESILSQTVLPDEIIICDDCSVDDTVAIAIKELSNSKISSSITVNESRLGFIKNFERAMGYCSGDIVLISDQDDCWIENKIEVVLKEFNLGNNIHLLINNQKLVDQGLNWYGETEFDSIDRINSRHLYISGCCTSVSKNFIKFALPIDSQVQGHDLWLHELASVLDVRKVTREPLQFYRRHGMNESNSLASSIIKASFFDRLSSIVNSKPEEKWMEEVRRLKLYIDKIENDKDIVTMLGIDYNTVRHARDNLKSRIEIIETRLLILRSKRYKKPLKVLRLYRTSGYNSFSGLKTAFLDVLR